MRFWGVTFQGKGFYFSLKVYLAHLKSSGHFSFVFLRGFFDSVLTGQTNGLVKTLKIYIG